MTKTEVVDKIAKVTGFKKSEVRAFLKAFAAIAQRNTGKDFGLFGMDWIPPRDERKSKVKKALKIVANRKRESASKTKKKASMTVRTGPGRTGKSFE